MAERFSEAVLELSTDDSGYKKGLDDAQKKAQGFQGTMNQVGSDLEKWGRKTTRVGTDLTLGLTAPIVGAGAAALSFSTDLNEGMANVASLIPGNTARVQELKREVQDLSIETGKGTRDMSDGLYEVVSAFGDSAATADILRIAARAAVGGVAQTGEAIDLVSAVTKGYGDTSAEAVQKASDLALMTVRLGQTNFPQLAVSMQDVTGMSGDLNVSQEELFATFATLTGVTGNAAKVSTQYRAILVGLQKPSDQMQAALEGIGFETGEAALETLGFKGTLDALLEQQGGNTASLQKLWGQTEAWNAISALAGSQSEVFRDKLAELMDAAGATDAAFREQTDGVNAAGFAWDQAKQKAIVAAQRLGDAVAPAMVDVLHAAEPLIGLLVRGADLFASLPEPIQTSVIALAALAAGTGPVLIGVGKVTQAIGVLTGGKGLAGLSLRLGKIQPAVKGLGVALVTPPLGLVIAIAAVVGWLVNLHLKLREAQQGLEDYAAAAKKTAQEQRALSIAAEPFLDVLADGTDAQMEWLEASKLNERQLSDLTRGLQAYADAHPEARQRVGESIISINQYRSDLRRAERAQEDAAETATDAGKAVAQAAAVQAEAFKLLGITTGRDLEPNLRALEQAQRSGLVPTGQLADLVQDLRQRMSEAVGVTEDQTDRIEALTAATADGADRWEGYERSADKVHGLMSQEDWFQQALAGAEQLHQELTAGVDVWARYEVASDKVFGKPVSPEVWFQQAGDGAAQFGDAWASALGDEGGSGPLGKIEGLFQGKFGPAVSSMLGDVLSGDSIAGAVENGLGLALSVGMNAPIPGLGVLAGPLVSALSALFGKVLGGLFGKTEAADVARQWGVTLSPELEAELQALGEQHGRDFGLAMMLSMDKVIRENVPGTVAEFELLEQKVWDVFSAADRGDISWATALEAFSRGLPELISHLDDVGGSAMMLQDRFSNLLTLAADGFLDWDAAVQLIESSVQQMSAAGVEDMGELIAWLERMGVELEGIPSAAEQAATEASSAWRSWAESMGISFDGVEIRSKQYFIDLAKSMGLSARIADRFVDGMLASQEEALAQYTNAQRQQFMEIGIQAGFVGEELKEFIRSAMSEWREEMGLTGDSARGRFKAMAEDAGLSAQQMRAVWQNLGPDLRHVFEEGEAVGRATFMEIAREAGLSAKQVRELWGSGQRDVSDIFKKLGEDGEGGNKKAGDAADLESARMARLFRMNVTDNVLPILRRMGDVGVQEVQRIADAVMGLGTGLEITVTASGSVPGFATGTGLEFLDFGPGTGVELHGPEAVLTRGQGMDLAEMLSGGVQAGMASALRDVRGTGQEDRRSDLLLAEIQGLRRDFNTTLPTQMERAARHGAQTVIRR